MKRVSIAVLVVLLTAGAALANGGGGRGPGNNGGGPEDRGGAGLLVADNGTVFITRTVTDSAANTSTTTLSAITPAGATAWTVTLANRGHLTLSGSNLLSVADTSTATATSSAITAISTSTGATAWTLNVNGRVHELEPFSGGTYAVVVVPPAAQGGSPTRSIVAISNSGTILWTVNV